jgi:hypothetical protein
MRREIDLTNYPHNWDGSVVLLVVRVRDDGPEPVIELCERRRVRDDPPFDKKIVAVPLTSLDNVVPYFETRLDIAESDRTGSLDERLTRCFAALVVLGVPRELNEITGLYSVDHVTRVAAWYTELGVAHELAEQFRGDRPMTRIRRYVLSRTRPPGEGVARTLWLELSAEYGRAGTIQFHESYKPHDGEPFVHSVAVDDYSALDRAVAAIEARAGARGADLEAQLVAAFANRIERGELGDGLPYRQNRDRVRAWWEEAGLTCRIEGRNYRQKLFDAVRLPDGDGLFLEVSSRTAEGAATVDFHQLYFAKGDFDREAIRTSVVTPLSSLEGLVSYFEGRAVPQPTEQRLVACLASLVERGELGAPLPGGLSADGNAERVATWYAEAGQPYEIRRERTYRLLRVYRRGTDCNFTLSLSLNTRTAYGSGGSAPVQFTAATFREYYDYLPQGGDAGREYGYSAAIPELPAVELAERFEDRLGVPPPADAHLDERLVACFAELVARGELADGLPIEANRDRIAELVTAIGLPVRTDSSHWINSE